MHERAKSASNIFRNISSSYAGKRAIVLNGAVPGLASLLRTPVHRIILYSITTLHNVLVVENEPNPTEEEKAVRKRAKQGVRSAGGIQAMMQLLRQDKEAKLRTILTDCLRILCMGDGEAKKIVLQAKGPEVLVNILNTQGYTNLILHTSRLLKVLSVCPANKEAIIVAGGVEAIATHLNHESNKVKSHCIWTLRNLSDAAANSQVGLFEKNNFGRGIFFNFAFFGRRTSGF